MTAWVVRGGRDGEAERWNLSRGRATVGWNEIGDLSDCRSREDVRALVDAALPEYMRPSVWSLIDDVVLGSAGKPLPGAQVTLRIRNYSGNTNTFWFVSDPAVSSTDAQSGTHLSSITLTADANGQVRLDNQPASGYLRHGSDGESGGSFFEVLLNGKVIGGFTLYNSSAAGGTDPGVQPTAG